VLELAVSTHPRERDPVVDLRDLVQGCAGVLREEQDPVRVLQGDHGPSAGDPLAGVLGPILDQLLGRNVGLPGHQDPAWLTMASKAPRTSVSGTSTTPSAVMVFTEGKMPRIGLGP